MPQNYALSLGQFITQFWKNEFQQFSSCLELMIYSTGVKLISTALLIRRHKMPAIPNAYRCHLFLGSCSHVLGNSSDSVMKLATAYAENIINLTQKNTAA